MTNPSQSTNSSHFHRPSSSSVNSSLSSLSTAASLHSRRGMNGGTGTSEMLPPPPLQSPSLSSIPSAFSSPAHDGGHSTRRYPASATSSVSGLPNAPQVSSIVTGRSTLMMTTPGGRSGIGDHHMPPGSAYSSRASSRNASPSRGGGNAMVDQQGQPLSLLQIQYGTRIVLRGPKGVTLTARLSVPKAGGDAGGDPIIPATPGPSAAGEGGGGVGVVIKGKPEYTACADGRGFGEAMECFTILNANRRDDKGSVCYGHAITLKSAKEKFMGVTQLGEVVFNRALVGTSEKWVIAKPDVIRSTRATGMAVLSTTASAMAAFKGIGVMAGDQIVLQAHTQEVLIVKDTVNGPEITKVAPEAALLAQATWEICFEGTPLYPAWNLTRPYLTGEFLLKPQRHASTSAHEEVFGILPHPSNRQEAKIPPLSQFPPPVQERILAEDLLWAVAGYEGKYIRIEAADDTGALSASLEDVRFTLDTESALPASLEDVRFTLDTDSVDRSLANFASKFLPLGSYCVRIRRFIDVKRRYDYGMVAQALAAGLQTTLKEYAVLVAQLEHKWLTSGLSLQKLWFFLQPSLRTLEILDNLCSKVWRSKGGAMLNLICASASAGGDDKSAKMHGYLLERAAAPYMTMLEGWIYQGQLDDPYHEFMVQEDQALAKENVQEDFNAAYWEKRCKIKEEHIFSLFADSKKQILTTGKYLNVIRECGQEVTPFTSNSSASGQQKSKRIAVGQAKRLSYADGKAGLGEAIEAAYKRACGLLLDLVIRQHLLLPRLASIKHYFLLDKGDFFVHLMNTAEHELLKNALDISPSRIESLLHLSIQMSVACNDPYKDDVSCTFVKVKLIEHLNAIHDPEQGRGGASRGAIGGGGGRGLASSVSSLSFIDDSSESLPPLPTNNAIDQNIKAYEAFMLEYQVKWPLSLVISRRAVTKYQLLFRHLFLTKYVERRLHTTWAEQQTTKELHVRDVMGTAFCLRHRMQHFMENYIYYMMFEVIEPHWHTLQEKLRGGGSGGDGGGEVQHVDDVIKLHQEFQDSCLKECLLTNPPLLKILNKIINVCMSFASSMEKMTEALVIGDPVAALSSTGASSMIRGPSAAAAAATAAQQEEEGILSQHHLYPSTSKLSTSSSTAAAATNGYRKGGSRGSSSVNTGQARRDRVTHQTKTVHLQAKKNRFANDVGIFNKHLDKHMVDFMKQLWEDSKNQFQSHLPNLITRLDYNGFFASRFATASR